MAAFKYIGGDGAPDSGEIFGFEVAVGSVIEVLSGHEAYSRISGHHWFELTTDAPTPATAVPEVEPANAFDVHDDEPLAVEGQTEPAGEIKRRRGRPPKARTEDASEPE